MKYSWRITKYNPDFRNENGNYTKDEWISIYDVGKKYSDSVFSIEEYLDVEEKYVDAIINLMEAAQIPYLELRFLSKWEQNIKFTEYYTDRMLNLLRNVKDKDILQKNELQDLCRLILRENIGCQLWYDSQMFVHFGYDYYMYIGVNYDCDDTIEKIKISGLFAEQYESPYINTDDSDDA